MEIFNLTLGQMVTMFLLIIVGYILRKSSVLPEDTHTTLSKLETFVFSPALSLISWSKYCTVKNLSGNWQLILYGTVLIAVAVGLAYPLSRLFVKNAFDPKDAYQRNIYKYALTFGNYGYIGNFIALSIWGMEGYFYYSMFNLVVGLVCSSWGLIILIPKDEGKVMSAKNIIRSFFTPPIKGILIGMVIGLFNISKYIPDCVFKACENASDCMGPISMILAGFVIGGFNIGSLLKIKKVYYATFLRLIVIPGVFLTVLKLIGADDLVLAYALFSFGAPLGLNTIIYPATYGGDYRTGASMAMISHTLSVITIPLMYLVFVVLF